MEARASGAISLSFEISYDALPYPTTYLDWILSRAIKDYSRDQVWPYVNVSNLVLDIVVLDNNYREMQGLLEAESSMHVVWTQRKKLNCTALLAATAM